MAEAYVESLAQWHMIWNCGGSTTARAGLCCDDKNYSMRSLQWTALLGPPATGFVIYTHAGHRKDTMSPGTVLHARSPGFCCSQTCSNVSRHGCLRVVCAQLLVCCWSVPSQLQLASACRVPCDAPSGAGDGVDAPSQLFPLQPKWDVSAGHPVGVRASIQVAGSEAWNQWCMRHVVVGLREFGKVD